MPRNFLPGSCWRFEKSINTPPKPLDLLSDLDQNRSHKKRLQSVAGLKIRVPRKVFLENRVTDTPAPDIRISRTKAGGTLIKFSSPESGVNANRPVGTANLA
jgi:hypothetical protein